MRLSEFFSVEMSTSRFETIRVPRVGAVRAPGRRVRAARACETLGRYLHARTTLTAECPLISSPLFPFLRVPPGTRGGTGPRPGRPFRHAGRACAVLSVARAVPGHRRRRLHTHTCHVRRVDGGGDRVQGRRGPAGRRDSIVRGARAANDGRFVWSRTI